MYEWLQEQILNEMKTPGASVNLYNALNLSLKYDSMNDVKQLLALTLNLPLPDDHTIMAIFPFISYPQWLWKIIWWERLEEERQSRRISYYE